MGGLDALMDALLGDKTFDLKIVSWRQYLQGAKRSQDRERLDDHRIGVRCRLQQSLMQGDTIVEDEGEEALQGLEFNIEIRSAQTLFAELDAVPATEEIKNGSGILVYHPPIKPHLLSGLAPSEIEKSRIGSVTGWVFFGYDTMREVSRLLTVQPELDIHLWATVNARANATPKSLIYEPQEYRPTQYRWTKNTALEIKAARIVVGKTPVSEDEPARAPTESPMMVLSRRVADGIDGLNKNVKQAGFIIVVAVVAILVELWQRR